VVSGRRIAVAEVDGLNRNGWTIWIGISGRVQPDWMDDLGRNGWTISPGILTHSLRAASSASSSISDPLPSSVERISGAGGVPQ